MKKIIGIIIIIICVILVLKISVSKKNTYIRTLVDVETKKIYQHKLKANKIPKFPVKSPYSGRNTSYPVYQCNVCKTVFAFIEVFPKTKEEEIKIPFEFTFPKCPKCGSVEIIIPVIPKEQKFIQLNEEIPIVDSKK